MSIREKQDLTPPPPPAPALLAIVPAAGLATRFGGGKLLVGLRGEPLLSHTLRCLLEGGVDRVVVVTSLGTDLSPVRLLNDPRVQLVVNPDPARGMFSSIQTGLAAAGVAAVSTLIHPADMPFVRASTVATVIAAARETRAIVTPTHAGRRGHPIALPPGAVAATLSAPADQDLKSVLAASGIDRVEVPVDDLGILRDVDVPADLYEPRN